MRISKLSFLFLFLGFVASAQSNQPKYAITCLSPCVVIDMLDGQVSDVLWTGPNGFKSKETQPKVCVAGEYKVSFKRNNTLYSDNIKVENQQIIPTAKVSGEYNLTCIFNCRNLVGNDPGIAYGTTWYGPNGFVENKLSVNICLPGRYVYKIFKGVCSSYDTIIVKDTKTIPTIDAGENVDLNCRLAVGTLKAVFPGSEYNYEWLSEDGKSYSKLLNPKVDKPGKYIFKIKRGVCEAKDTVTVSSDFRKPSVNGLQTYKISCIQKNIETQLQCNLPDAKFEWRDLNNQIVSTKLNNKFSNIGAYYLRSYIEKSGCESGFNIIVNPKDTLSISLHTVDACADQPTGEVHLDKVVGGVPPYEISLFEGGFEAKKSITKLSTAAYRLFVRDANSCMSNSNFVIGDRHTFQWNLPKEFTFCSYKEPLVIDASIDDPTTPIQYRWSDGSVGAKKIFTQSGKGWVEATSPCQYERHNFEIKDQFDQIRTAQYYSPNIINPLSINSANRCFHPYLGFPVQSYELRIYDRWGNLVFLTNKQDDCWDGTFKGKQINFGTFFWQVFVQIDGCGNPVPWQKSGGISIYTED